MAEQKDVIVVFKLWNVHHLIPFTILERGHYSIPPFWIAFIDWASWKCTKGHGYSSKGRGYSTKGRGYSTKGRGYRFSHFIILKHVTSINHVLEKSPKVPCIRLHSCEL